MTPCLTCVSRVSPPFASPTCLYWPSDHFGAAELPEGGCEHFRPRDGEPVTEAYTLPATDDATAEVADA